MGLAFPRTHCDLTVHSGALHGGRNWIRLAELLWYF